MAEVSAIKKQQTLVNYSNTRVMIITDPLSSLFAITNVNEDRITFRDMRVQIKNHGNLHLYRTKATSVTQGIKRQMPQLKIHFTRTQLTLITT